MSQGWVKLYRELLKKPIWIKSTPEQKTILITLLLMANHESNEWEWQGIKFNVKPGQFITSLDEIVKACGKGITIQNVRTSLNKFEKYEFLTNKSTKTGRLITIENWTSYQCTESESNKEINKDLTKSQQRPNKDLTPNKNDNNEKNDKKIKYAEFVSMTKEEYDKLVSEHGEILTRKMISILDNYKGSSGKKYKSDYRAILTWVVKKIQEEVKTVPYSNAVEVIL